MTGRATPQQRQMLIQAVENGGRLPPTYSPAVRQVRLHLERAGWMEGWEVTAAGRLLVSPASLQIRLWTRIEQPPDSPCWEWQGARTRGGYGRIKNGAKLEGTHRVAYRLAKGEIPDGMVVMHSCDNPPCCNPAHLSLGTVADNNADKTRKGRGYVPTNGPDWHRAKTHCPQGHEYTAENTRICNKGKRNCRACARARFRATKVPRPRSPRAVKTHCPQGHAYVESNVYIDPKGVRTCRECKRESARKWRADQRPAHTDSPHTDSPLRWHAAAAP